MKLKKSFLLLLVIPLLSFSAHKYYLSLTQIKFNEEAKSVQIIINVFMDDIETALNKDNNIDLQLTTKKELKNNDVYFEKYFHFLEYCNPLGIENLHKEGKNLELIKILRTESISYLKIIKKE
jgi:hypothetical protein